MNIAPVLNNPYVNDRAKPISKILLVLLIEIMLEIRFRSFQRSTLVLCKSNSCKVKSCQIRKFENNSAPRQGFCKAM